MNKEFRCKSNYTLSTKIRNAQSLILSGAQGVGVTTYKLSGTAARASLLQVLSIEATATGKMDMLVHSRLKQVTLELNNGLSESL